MTAHFDRDGKNAQQPETDSLPRQIIVRTNGRDHAPWGKGSMYEPNTEEGGWMRCTRMMVCEETLFRHQVRRNSFC